MPLANTVAFFHGDQLAGGVEKHRKNLFLQVSPKTWRLERLVEVRRRYWGGCARSNKPNGGRCGGEKTRRVVAATNQAATGKQGRRRRRPTAALGLKKVAAVMH